MSPAWEVLAGLGAAYTVGPQAAARLGLGVVRARPQARGLVALTFDDGPWAGSTERVLRILAEHDAQATFFMVGARVEARPDLARTVVEAGHAIGNHTQHHRHLWTAGPLATWRELAAASEAIAEATGARPRLFRPPWGILNLASLAVCRKLGMAPVLWSVRSEGFFWRPGPEEMAEDVLRQACDGAIVDLHDAGPGGAEPTAVLEALPLVLRGLGRLGLRSVGLPALLGL